MSKNILMVEENHLFSNFFEQEISNIPGHKVDIVDNSEIKELSTLMLNNKYQLLILSYKFLLGEHKNTIINFIKTYKFTKVFLAVSPVFDHMNVKNTIGEFAVDFAFTKPIKEEELTHDLISRIFKEYYSKSSSQAKTVFYKNMGYPQLITIGSSTGGPKALLELFSNIHKSSLTVPVFITQHMPEKFTSLLAKQIEKVTGITTHEAGHNDVAKPGHIYISPGGVHMLIKIVDDKFVIKLDDGPAENFCKPSVDTMLRSIADSTATSLVIILTGMGKDGLNGCQAIKDRKSGYIIAQDKKSSVVWGMPGAIVSNNLADIVGTVKEIAFEVNNIMRK